MSGRATLAEASLALAGLVIWFAHFNLAYALNALACARGIGVGEATGFGAAHAAIVGITAVAIGAAALVWRRARAGDAADPGRVDHADTGRLLRFLASGGALLAMLAILWTALPMLFVRPCG